MKVGVAGRRVPAVPAPPTDDQRARALREAVGYPHGSWTIDALASRWRRTRGEVSDWLAGRRSVPVRVITTLDPTESATYYATLYGAAPEAA